MPTRAALFVSLSLLAACGPKDAGDSGATSIGEPDSTAAGSSGDVTGGPTGTTGEPTGGSSTVTGDGTTGTSSGEPTSGSTAATVSSTGDQPSPDLACPEAIDQAILACVADLQSDPELVEGNFLLDLLWMCADAEPVADDYDAHCVEQPGDPICGLDYAQFVETVLPQCIGRAQAVVFADVCLLPATYDELLFAPGIVLMQRGFVIAAGELDDTEQQQFLRASAELGVASATVEEALLATDEDGVEQLTVLDLGTDRVLVLYSAHYGGTRAGRMFFWQTFAIVGAVEDGAFGRCGVEQAIEGRPCEDALACGEEHACIDILEDEGGVVLAPGTCVSEVVIPGTGEPCSAHGECAPTSGLLCLDIAQEGGDGECRPGWMRRSFSGPAGDSALLAGDTLLLPIVVSGVATFPTAAYLDLQLAEDMANTVAIHLVNPAGTSTPVTTAEGPLLDLQLFEVAGLPTNEDASGTWHLAVEDVDGSASGVVTRLALTLDTRPD